MTDLTELRNDILREMYSNAEPPLNFDALLESPNEYPDDWYSRHHLPKDKQEEIFNKHVTDKDLTDSEHIDLSITCITSLGPTSSKENRDEHRAQEDRTNERE